ncbi:GNAT superfamily N-acetyltransferase [Inquilinus ginsengisoli]|uniref:GNAT superfamily N-acetyltransferase n=1 Tax=Inquilinus ginsengisoli TaxID=363840 RepID=A0ABU1JLY8_9PROT|nr:GNAT family N-acetyltransferase [Inquilinus ginsengisoli]MDR6288555.1 GNAT superfamily N-acetyltransferase [Inquilinus ginsengisoli]
MTAPAIRPARPEEAAALSALVLRSKAHWGYDAAFMAQVRDVLQVTPEAIRAGGVFVAVDGDDRPLGLGSVGIADGAAELELLFVDPAAMGQGAGRALYRHAVAMARAGGAGTLWILADPGAEPFYRAMGATTVGQAPSDAIPGRMLPRMKAELTA